MVVIHIPDHRFLPPLPGLRHSARWAGLERRLREDYGLPRPAVVVDTAHLASPATAARAVTAAARQVADCGLLIVGIAGYLLSFRRRQGDVHAVALPGSVPGRPGSALAFPAFAAALAAARPDEPMLVCADLTPLTGDRDGTLDEAGRTVEDLAGAFQQRQTEVSLLMGFPGAEAAGACHDSLDAVLGDLAASGGDATIREVAARAAARADATGVRAHAIPGGVEVRITPAAGGERLADYIRADLFAPDAGSRLDAAVELAELARSGDGYAAACLDRLARHDPAGPVRTYAGMLQRGTSGPSAADLREAGLIPAQVWDEAKQGDLLPVLRAHPGGRTPLGADAPHGQPGEHPRHHTTVEPFLLGLAPVTNRQYLAFLIDAGGACPEHWAEHAAVWAGEDLPVVMVSWLDALRYCGWLTAQLRATGSLDADQTVTLPSEAEWEHAAGNGRGDPYPWGGQPDPSRCNIRATGIGRVTAPGRFSPSGDSASGCVDLIGNVWEWTRSAWGRSGRSPDYGYPYDPDDGRETLDADPAMRRIIRGGGYYYATACANTYTRNRMLPTDRHPAGGFRVAVTRTTPQPAPTGTTP